jgi:hypothetical protein
MKRSITKRNTRARKPLGTLPPRDEQEIDMAALITPTDIDEAKAHARRYGTQRLNAILNAERAEVNA